MDDEMDVEQMSESETETSVGSINREEQQDLIEHYTAVMLQKVISDPYVSAPEMMEVLRGGGPYESRQTVLQVIGGRDIFRSTGRRMYLVRRATLEGTLGGLPVEIRPFPWEEVGGTVPGTERFVESWAPWKTDGEFLFEEDPMFDDNAEDIPRCPHMGEY